MKSPKNHVSVKQKPWCTHIRSIASPSIEHNQKQNIQEIQPIKYSWKTWKPPCLKYTSNTTKINMGSKTYVERMDGWSKCVREFAPYLRGHTWHTSKSYCRERGRSRLFTFWKLGIVFFKRSKKGVWGVGRSVRCVLFVRALQPRSPPYLASSAKTDNTPYHSWGGRIQILTGQFGQIVPVFLKLFIFLASMGTFWKRGTICPFCPASFINSPQFL